MADRTGNVMKNILLFLLISGVAAAQAPKAKSAVAKAVPFNKAEFESYVRHLNVWPAAIAMEVTDPKPSDLPGFLSVTVKASQGKAHQEETFYVSKDYKKIIRGTVYDSHREPIQEQSGQAEDRASAQSWHSGRACRSGGVHRF